MKSFAYKNRFLIIVLNFIISLPIFAAEGGYSNYVPGVYGDFTAGVAPQTPWTFRNDLYLYKAKGGRAVRSGRLVIDANVKATANLLTTIYKPNIELFGGEYVFGVVLPYVKVDVGAGVNLLGMQRRLQDSSSGIGDIALIPGIFYWKRSNFYISVSEFIILPVGRYTVGKMANVGLNYYTSDTNIVANYFNKETGQDYAVNIGYNVNSRNQATEYKTGKEIHIDYMLNQFLSDNWAVGITGFYLKQLSDDSGYAAVLSGFRSHAQGVGTAVLYNTSISDTSVAFLAKWMHEYEAKYRLKGNNFYFSVVIGT